MRKNRIGEWALILIGLTCFAAAIYFYYQIQDVYSIFAYYGADCLAHEGCRQMITNFRFAVISFSTAGLILLSAAVILFLRSRKDFETERYPGPIEEFERYPQFKDRNVKGKYYVNCDGCLDTQACIVEAPNNIRIDDEQCIAYVFKQPETPEEQEQCRNAKDVCPVEAINDDGESINR